MINESITIIDENDINFNEDLFYINDTLKGYIHSIKYEIEKNIELFELPAEK